MRLISALIRLSLINRFGSSRKCGLRIQILIQNAKSGPDTNDEPITRLAFQPCSSEHFDYEVEIISDLVTFFAMAVTTENTKTRK